MTLLSSTTTTSSTFSIFSTFLGPFRAMLIATTLLTLLPALISAQVSICQQGSFSALRNCAAYCIANGNGLQNTQYCDYLAISLDCGTPASRVLNNCFCRSDLQTAASSILSSCVSFNCQTLGGDWSIDASQAVSVYNNYCSSAVGGPGPRTSSATTGPASNSASATSSGTVTVTQVTVIAGVPSTVTRVIINGDTTSTIGTAGGPTNAAAGGFGGAREGLLVGGRIASVVLGMGVAVAATGVLGWRLLF